MLFAMAFVIWGAQDLPTRMTFEEYEPKDFLFVRLTAGVWASPKFQFDATETTGTHVEARVSYLGSGGLSFGATVDEHWVFFGTLEVNGRSSFHSNLAGLSLGFREYTKPGQSEVLPESVMIYAGPIGGTFKITTAEFGDFKDAIGGRLGVDLSWRLGRSVRLGVDAEWRYIKFFYKPPLSQGNPWIGGGGYWLGAALEIRF
jgi:hypothetical protein